MYNNLSIAKDGRVEIGDWSSNIYVPSHIEDGGLYRSDQIVTTKMRDHIDELTDIADIWHDRGYVYLPDVWWDQCSIGRVQIRGLDLRVSLSALWAAVGCAHLSYEAWCDYVSDTDKCGDGTDRGYIDDYGVALMRTANLVRQIYQLAPIQWPI